MFRNKHLKGAYPAVAAELTGTHSRGALAEAGIYPEFKQTALAQRYAWAGMAR